MASDLDALQWIRSGFVAAAATCDRGAKVIVQASSELIAARKHKRRGKLAKLLGRLR
jgi:hypothetical protein